MLIILYTKDEVSFDRFHENRQAIFRVVHDEIGPDGKIFQQDGNSGMMPGPSFAREIPEIKAFVRFQGERLPVKIGAEIFEQEGHYADTNFFSVFTFPMKEGNPATALKGLYSVVLTEETARKLFGTTAALGRTLELPLGEERAFIPFTVTGILQESPQNSSLRLSMLLPISLNERNNGGDTEWINFYLNTFVLLNPGADTRRVEAKMADVYNRSAKEQIRQAKEQFDFKNSFIYKLQPLEEMHLSTVYRATNGLTGASNPIYARILGGIALFILLIACINFVNLSVARSLKRSREIGIRKVSGGTRGQLILQFLGESLFLTILAFLLALVMVQLILPFFNTVSNKALSIAYLLDARLVGGYILLLLVTAGLAGFYPALVLSGFDPVDTLYNRSGFSGKHYLSRALVILQFSLSTFLIVATITIYSQFNYLTSQELRYDDKNLLVLETGRMSPAEANTFRNELLKHPSVAGVAARQYGFWSTLAKTDGKEIEFSMDVIDDYYLETLKIPIVRGRGFSADFPGDTAASILVNEAFVKKAGWKDPIGKEVDFFYRNKKYRVAGVVKDYHYESLLEEIRPQLFTKDNREFGTLLVRLRPGGTSLAVKDIEQIFKKQRPLQPWKYEFVEDRNRQQYASEQKWKQIMSFGAILTILISCIGLFGLASLTAEKRKKEIGIRKVLGASATSVANRLSFDFLKLVLLSGAISLPLSWWAANKWLENYPLRIQVNAWILLGALLAVVLVALVTISYQAIRAALANPVISLRSE
jgi:putative ABC transport system permease protein